MSPNEPSVSAGQKTGMLFCKNNIVTNQRRLCTSISITIFFLSKHLLHGHFLEKPPALLLTFVKESGRPSDSLG